MYSSPFPQKCAANRGERNATYGDSGTLIKALHCANSETKSYQIINGFVFCRWVPY